MRELAFYYPGPVWHSGAHIKNLILFFDGVALLVPDYIRNKPFMEDPAIAEGLRQHGLLEILEPETFIDAAATSAMSDRLLAIIGSGALEPLTAAAGTTAFHELSYSRLGGMADSKTADKLLGELQRRGWARRTEDGLSIPMHPVLRSLILVLGAQLLRPIGRKRGFELWPTTDRIELLKALRQVLELPEFPSAGHVVTGDLETVSIDLAPIPMDEILAFRRQHGPAFRAYARALRAFVRSLGPMSKEDRGSATADRADAIRDAAQNLREESRRAWKRPASVALGIAGAAWTLHSGDVAAGAVGLAGALVGGDLRSRQKVDAYSYLLAAGNRYGRRAISSGD
jgi:hypothetical protein